MRITREQAQQNRAQVVETASTLFRERGFDGIGLAEVMKEAGFTHGGFYNHFGSKDALEAAALGQAFAQMAEHRAGSATLEELLTKYLSNAARRHPGKSCPAAALAGDVARKSLPVRAEFAAGLEGMIASFAAYPGTESRAAAIDLLTRMVGALMLARAVPDDHPLSQEILAVAREAALAR